MNRYLIIIVTVLVSSFVNVLNAQGFTKHVITEDAEVARMIGVIDFNSDGFADVLSAEFDRTVFFENLQNGTFAPPQTINMGFGQCFYAAAADLDGDGDDDLISTSFDDGLVYWQRNEDGLGAFSAPIIIDTAQERPDDVSVADIDGDGDLDILVSVDFIADVVWYRNLDGLGTFSGPNVVTTNNTNGRSSRAADFDGDGDLDVATANIFDTPLNWFSNDGDGNFSPNPTIGETQFNIQQILVTDLDLDGDSDILTATNGENRVSWHRNDGLGNFTNALDITVEADGALFMAVGDLDLDGFVDVVSASNHDNKFAWYRHLDGQGTFGPQQILEQGVDHARSVAVADIDNDGDLDVIASSQNDSTIVWFENDTILNVAELDASLVTIYPNPVEDVLHIVANGALIERVHILDMKGAIIVSHKKSLSIDVSNLKAGIYFVEIIAKEGSLLRKVIKE